MEHFVPSFQISWHNIADAVYKLLLQVSLSRLTNVLFILKPHRSINNIFERKAVNIFLPISFNIWFGCSKEPSQWDGSLSTHGICFDIDIIRIFFFFVLRRVAYYPRGRSLPVLPAVVIIVSKTNWCTAEIDVFFLQSRPLDKSAYRYVKYLDISFSSQRTKIFQYCTCPAGWVTYNSHSSCKHVQCPLKEYAIKNIRE